MALSFPVLAVLRDQSDRTLACIMRSEDMYQTNGVANSCSSEEYSEEYVVRVGFSLLL